LEFQQNAPLMDQIPGLSCPALALVPDDRPTGVAAVVPRALQVRPTRVLVVESQHDLAAALASHLRRAGYEVCTASDGLAALYGLRHHRPDLVVLDLDVPRVSGFRLLHVLKEDRVEGPLRVLVVTALSFDEAREAARAGADGFLQLPCSPGEVLDSMRRMLTRSAPPLTAPVSSSPSPARFADAEVAVPAA
jgi:DNA-binding response OmpR family regulator